MYYVVNAITVYRLVAAPVLVVLVFTNQLEIFKWLLPVSFFTDAIDGPLARRYKVTSIAGSKLDSISDDLTVLAGITGMIVFKRDFLLEHIVPVLFLLGLFAVQVSLAFWKFGRMTSFHTYAAKLAALLQGVFLILTFFLPSPPVALFYSAIVVTGLDLLEEIIITMVIPKWQTDVKGLYWVLRNRQRN